MSGTGLTFTGCIGVGVPTFPTSHSCASGMNAGGATTTVTVGPPSGVAVGDVMVACYGAGAYSGSGTNVVSAASGWTLVHSTLLVGDEGARLYSKIADASDAAGTSSYTWGISRSGGLTGLTVIHASWPAVFGTTVGPASSNNDPSPSIASPGGSWQFAFIYERSASGGSEPSPNPVVTSPATFWCERTSGTSDGHRAGNMRAYASDNVSPVTGAYLQGGIDFARRSMFVAAVS